MGIVVRTHNPLAPWRDRELTQLDEPILVGDYLAKNDIVFNQPTICLCNGDAVLRADWHTTMIGDIDIVTFVALPEGGRGGSNILQIVLSLATLAVAAFAGPLIAAAAGFSSAAAGSVASGLIFAAGNAIVSLLTPVNNGLTSLRNNQLAAPSPTYSIQAQGNSARLGAAIPVIYGRHRVFPDFAAAPYTEFRDNEQYLYQLFCIGQGDYDLIDLRIEDTPVSSFDEVSYVKYAPAEVVTAFPARVESSGEVAGQELDDNTIGFFYANAANTQINAIGIDIVAPNGMFYANDQGGLDQRSASFVIEAAVETNGVLGAFLIILNQTISGATNTPIRKSYRVDLAPGRYAIRARRTNPKDTSSRAGNTIIWAGLRGYYPGLQSYGNVTMIAMVLRATNNLSQQASRRINCLVQRKLRQWSPSTGWSAPIATRSIVWAIADVATADYGLKLRNNQIDLQGFYALEQYFLQRNFALPVPDYCDIVFDNGVSAWEAMANIGQCGRSQPIFHGGLLRLVRDTQQAIITTLFSGRNITKGSFSINYIMPGDQTADSVIIEWFNKDTLTQQETPCTLPGGTNTNPARVRIQGISSNEQAYREGITIAANNRYRRKEITFQTELDGFIPSVGDLVAISHPMPNWGVAGELIDVSGIDLTLSESVDFIPNQQHYIVLRKQDGSTAGPFNANPHISGDPNRITLQNGTNIGFTPYTGTNAERTYFIFGSTSNIYMLGKIVPPIRPRGRNLVELHCVADDTNVYLAEGGNIPNLPSPSDLPRRITRPNLVRLDVNYGGTAANPILLLSWPPVPDADHYLVETSTDNANWQSHPPTSSSSYTVVVDPGLGYVRIAAVGLARGNWVTSQYLTGVIPPPGDVAGLSSSENFVGTRARLKWLPVNRATYYKVEVYALSLLRRTITQTATEFDYSAEDVVRDGGPWRSLTFNVRAGNDQGESVNPAILTLFNPQEGALTGVFVYSGTRSAVITYTVPSDIDHAGIRVCMSQMPGFTPDDTNVVYEGNDRVITVPGLTEGSSYYFRLAGYDSFGKDSLIYTGQFSATILSSNLPTPEEIKSGLQTALDQAVDPLIFESTAFALRLAGTDKTPFIVGSIDGNPAILLDADVGILGTLSADQIRSGSLQATESIAIGNGNALINGDGSFLSYAGDNSVANRDFALLTGGNLTFQRFADGAYHVYKSVQRVETGIANSGQTVIIPGYWDSQPKLLVSANSLQSYSAANATSSQTWMIRADNLRETTPGSRQWQFDAIAELNFSSSSGQRNLSYFVSTASNTYVSAADTLPINTVTATVVVQLQSIQGTGNHTAEYFQRAVQWTVQGFNGVGWIDLATKTRLFQPSEHGAVITDTQAVNTAGYSQIRVSYSAYNTGATYFTAGDLYNYQQNNVASNGAQVQVNFGNQVSINSPQILGSSQYSPPLGWEIYGVDYGVSFSYNVFSGSARLFSTDFIINIAASRNINPSGNGIVNSGVKFVANYDQNFWAAFVDLYVNSNPDIIFTNNFRLSNPTAIVYLRQLIRNTQAIANFFNFSSYFWDIAGSTAITTGSLSWQAIGD